MHRSIPAATLLGALAVGAATPLAAGTITVGADAACDHGTLLGGILAAAINAGPDEIRLARNQTYTDQDFHLTNWDPAGAGALTIAGGYDDCIDTQPSGRTEIDGIAQRPVFEIDTTGAESSVVTLRQLAITGSGQRGILVEGQSDLALEGSMVTLNAGGGVLVRDGAILTMDSGSSIFDNDTVAAGAGISCSAGGMELEGVIQGNDSIQEGGGIRATGCIVTLRRLLIYANSAFKGGGLAADGGSFVQALGGTWAVIFRQNDATDLGGGVYATDATVSLVGTTVESNLAQNAGGGLFADAGGLISMDRPSGSCGGRSRCSWLRANDVNPSSLEDDGAVAATAGDGELRLFQTWIEESVAGASPTSSAIRVAGTGSILRIEGASFSGNWVNRLVEVGSGASADLAFVSASDNGYPGNPPAGPIYVQSGGTARVLSSVFHPSNILGSDAAGAISEIDCVMVSDLAHLGAGATRSVAGDPLFADPASGDLRLRPESPAVDYCDATVYAPAHGDGDGEARGFDLPSNPNGSPGVTGGLFDLGFDEIRLLFADGFESGDTSAWSSVTP